MSSQPLRARRGRGRPPLRFRARGRPAQNTPISSTPVAPAAEASSSASSKLVANPIPESTPVAPAAETSSSASSNLVANPLLEPTAWEARILEVLSRSRTDGILPPSFIPISFEKHPFLLDPISRDGANCRLLKQVPTDEIHAWFDAQRNDYNCHKFSPTLSVDIVWFGRPGDAPVDVRARQFIVRWNDASGLTGHTRLNAIKQGSVVARWEYICHGACSRINIDDESEDAQSDGEQFGAKLPRKKDDKVSRWKRCANNVKLVIEITADDLSRGNIWQYNHHEDADLEHLTWSRRLRNMVLEYRMVGASANAIMKEVVSNYGNASLATRSTNAPSQEYSYEFPPWRRPTETQIKSIMHSVSRKRKNSNSL